MKYLLNYLIFVHFINTGLSNVLELNDKFLDIYQKDHSRSWLIKFYAPWCHHCRTIEKTYNEVGELVKQMGMPNLMVGKIDCTKYTSIASHFGIRGFPTIMYIDSKRRVEYVGDRNKDEMIEFLKRLSGPSIRKLTNCDELENIKKQHNVFFINFADEPTLDFSESASQFHSTDWFYFLDKSCPNFDFNSIYSVKTSMRNNVILKKYDLDSQSLNEWIRLERFPKFIRIGMSNLHYFMNTNKLLAIVLIRESKISQSTSKKEREYYEILEQIANSYSHSDQFIFGWTNQLDMINSIAIRTIEPIPNFIFINSSTMNYYLYDDDIIESENKVDNEKELIKVLNSFVDKQPILDVQGGNSYWDKFKRLGFDGFVAVSLMFQSNPILTIILFGLPITFFSIIIYCSCCSDMLDGDNRLDDEFDELSEEDEKYDSNGTDEEEYELMKSSNNENSDDLIDDDDKFKNEDKNETDHLKSD